MDAMLLPQLYLLNRRRNVKANPIPANDVTGIGKNLPTAHISSDRQRKPLSSLDYYQPH